MEVNQRNIKVWSTIGPRATLGIAALDLAKAALSQKIAGIFLESHPDPTKALCDGPSALPLNLLEPYLYQLKEIDSLVKNQCDIEISWFLVKSSGINSFMIFVEFFLSKFLRWICIVSNFSKSIFGCINFSFAR